MEKPKINVNGITREMTDMEYALYLAEQEDDRPVNNCLVCGNPTNSINEQICEECKSAIIELREQK